MLEHNIMPLRKIFYIESENSTIYFLDYLESNYQITKNNYLNLNYFNLINYLEEFINFYFFYISNKYQVFLGTWQ